VSTTTTPLLAHRPVRESSRSFESIYRKHVRDVYGFSLSILGNAHDAEDVTQTTFLNAYRALNGSERIENVRAWLLAIAHNVCRQRWRTAARRPQEVELDPEAAEAFQDEEAPSAGEIRAAMAELSFNHRVVLVLREIEGLAYEEIAETMGLSLSAVETLLFRARLALREQLEAADHDLGCEAVERLISLQLDGRLSRQDRRLLRAHLRSCAECARFARSQRARKKVMPGIVAGPLPAGLTGGFGAGGSGAGALGVAVSKAVGLAASAALIGTGALVASGVVSVPGIAASRPPTQAPARAADGLEAVGSFASSPGALSHEGRATVVPDDVRAAQAPGGALEASNGTGGASDEGTLNATVGTVATAGGGSLAPIGSALAPAADAVDAVGDTVDAVGDTLDAVGDTVDEVTSQLSPPPVSTTVETSTLPTVTPPLDDPLP
jgi:RNA polymerase sigma factor (sigma-70 family)